MSISRSTTALLGLVALTALWTSKAEAAPGEGAQALFDRLAPESAAQEIQHVMAELETRTAGIITERVHDLASYGSSVALIRGALAIEKLRAAPLGMLTIGATKVVRAQEFALREQIQLERGDDQHVFSAAIGKPEGTITHLRTNTRLGQVTDRREGVTSSFGAHWHTDRPVVLEVQQEPVFSYPGQPATRVTHRFAVDGQMLKWVESKAQLGEQARVVVPSTKGMMSISTTNGSNAQPTIRIAPIPRVPIKSSRPL